MGQVAERSPLEAGREAIKAQSWREGFELLKRADESGELGARDLKLLAESAWWSGRLDDSISALERAYAAFISTGDELSAAGVALDLAENHFAKLAHAVGAGWLSGAEKLLVHQPESVQHGYLAVMHAEGAATAGDLEAGLASAERALDIGMRLGDRDLQAFGLLFKGKILVDKGEVQEGLTLLDEATVAAVGGELGPFASGVVYCVAISTSAGLADYNRAGQWTEASKRWCERQSIAGFPGICRVHRAEIMRLRGSWVEAEQEARKALTELKSFNLQFAGEGFYELGEVRMRMGDLEGAEEAFRQAHELGRDPQPGLALLRFALGKGEAGFKGIARALEDAGLDRLRRARLIPALVEIGIQLGRIDEARAAVEDFAEIVQTYDSLALTASYLCSRGALELAEGDAAAAIKSLKKSRRLWTEADLPYEAARARLALGLALRADGDEDGAEFEISAARSAFEKLGAILDVIRAKELLGEASGSSGTGAAPAVRLKKTFMFTDIVDSTKLAEALGEDAWSGVLAWHDQALRAAIADHAGEEVKHLGDGFFAAFDAPDDAVESAACIQRRLDEHRREHGFAPRVRIGLHCAEATRKGADYEGRGVHEAARIGALANAGEILASEDVVTTASIRFPVSEFKAVQLKGISEPVRVATIEGH